MKGIKLSQLTLLIGVLMFARPGIAAISVNEIDNLGADESPLPIETFPTQPQLPKPQLKIYPAINIWGYTGRYDTAKGQLLWPFCGNNIDSAFYGLGEFSNANKDTGWMVGFGGGYRRVINASYILGWYLIGDIDSSTNHHGFLIANPGVELLGKTWDFRVNAYVPISQKDNWYQGEYRNAQNQRYGWLEEVGPGFDFEIGSNIPYLHNVKAFIESYTFVNSNTDNAVGFGGRIEYNWRRFLGFELRAIHDDELKTTVLVGLRFTVGGLSNIPEYQETTVARRLADPVMHNFGSPGTGYGIPIQNRYIYP